MYEKLQPTNIPQANAIIKLSVEIEFYCSEKFSAPAFEKKIMELIPGINLKRTATQFKRVMYEASTTQPRNLVLLGIAIQVCCELDKIKGHEISQQ
jgi:hypothetical protein